MIDESYSVEVMTAILRRAFRPYLCVPYLQAAEEKVVFRVYGDGSKLLETFEGYSVTELRNPRRLREIIVAVRDHCEAAHGIRFDELPPGLVD